MEEDPQVACPHCGTTKPAEDAYCLHCHQRLDDSSKEAPFPQERSGTVSSSPDTRVTTRWEEEPGSGPPLSVPSFWGADANAYRTGFSHGRLAPGALIVFGIGILGIAFFLGTTPASCTSTNGGPQSCTPPNTGVALGFAVLGGLALLAGSVWAVMWLEDPPYTTQRSPTKVVTVERTVKVPTGPARWTCRFCGSSNPGEGNRCFSCDAPRGSPT